MIKKKSKYKGYSRNCWDKGFSFTFPAGKNFSLRLLNFCPRIEVKEEDPSPPKKKKPRTKQNKKKKKKKTKKTTTK